MKRTIFVTEATLLSECEKCKEPSTGSFYSDHHQDMDERFFAKTTCVNCGHMQLEYIKPEFEVTE